MRNNTSISEDTTIREALDSSAVQELVAIIDRLDESLDQAVEESIKLSDRIESLERLLIGKDAIIRDLESQIESI